MSDQQIQKGRVQIFPCTIKGVYCDIHPCRTLATHFLGRPDAPISTLFKLCDKHKQELFDSIISVPWNEPEQKAAPDHPQEKPEGQRNQDFPKEYICSYCGESFSGPDYSKHRRTCPKRPKVI